MPGRASIPKIFKNPSLENSIPSIPILFYPQKFQSGKFQKSGYRQLFHLEIKRDCSAVFVFGRGGELVLFGPLNGFVFQFTVACGGVFAGVIGADHLAGIIHTNFDDDTTGLLRIVDHGGSAYHFATAEAAADGRADTCA